MADRSDLNRIPALQIEEDSVIATAETKARNRGLKLFHFTGSAAEVAIHAAKNLQSGLAIDRAKIGAGLLGTTGRKCVPD